MEPTGGQLTQAARRFARESQGYFGQWIFDEPALMSAERDRDFLRLHGLLLRVIREFVVNNGAYRHLMALDDRTRAIVDLLKEFPYDPGTFRTDFVFDPSGQPKLIEITCRFALNGFFEAAIYAAHAEAHAAAHFPEVPLNHRVWGIYDYLETLLEGKAEVLVLKGEDAKNSSRHYVGIFEGAGVAISEVHHRELPSLMPRLARALVISELTLVEILGLGDEVILGLAQTSLLNDVRTALLIHDKRFFSALHDEGLQRACLDAEEREFFNRFLVASHAAGTSPEVWQRARTEPDRWFLKHRALGKSENVYSGKEIGAEAWRQLLDATDLADFILQEFVPQKLWTGTMNGQARADYITGSLLYFNDHYFGPNQLRTSESLTMKSTTKPNVGMLVCEAPLSQSVDVASLPLFAYFA